MPKRREVSRHTIIFLFNFFTMKKLALFSALFALTVSLFFVACKKDEFQKINNNLEYANPNNPYDYVGVRHNEGLDILKKNTDDRNINLAQYLQILADNGIGDASYKPIAEDFVLMLSSKDPIKVIMDKLQKEGRVSEALYSSMLQLDEIVQTKGFSNELTPAVKSFEATITSLNLSTKEAEFLYHATSIARYSNAYWIEDGMNSTIERRPTPKQVYAISCDIIAGAATIETGPGALGAAAAASALAERWWDFCNSLIMPPHYGWPWGGGIIGYPCNPGYACPCTIDLNPAGIDPYYMVGTGLSLLENAVVLDMDGAALDPAFINGLRGGTFDLSTTFTVPQDVVNRIYESNTFPTPTEPTVFTQGLKDVIDVEGNSCILFPVTYSDGSKVTWYVIVDAN